MEKRSVLFTAVFFLDGRKVDLEVRVPTQASAQYALAVANLTLDERGYPEERKVYLTSWD